MTTIDVSVVLTSYNHAPYLRRAIESVLEQTYEDLELIIVDNGSTDDSPALLREFERFPNVIVIRHEANRSHAVICNEGVRAARGAYVGFLFSDDYYLPGKIEAQMARFATLPSRTGVVYTGGYFLIEDTGRLVLDRRRKHRGRILETLLTGAAFILPVSPLYRRQCLLEFPFYEDVSYEGEFILTKIASRYEFDYVEAPLVVVRESRSSRGKNLDEALAVNLDLYRRFFESPAFPPECASLRDRAIAYLLVLKGWQMIRERRDYARGGALIRDALGKDWRRLADYRAVLGTILSAVPAAMADIVSNRLDAARRASRFEGRSLPFGSAKPGG